MKKIFLFAAVVMTWAVSSAASDDSDDDGVDYVDLKKVETIQGVDLFGMNDGEYDWSQADEKTHKVTAKKDGILIESKKDDVFPFTVAEVMNFNPEAQDFIARFVFDPDEISDDKFVALLFDFKSNKNYKAIILKKKKIELVEVVKGEWETINENIFKYKNGKRDGMEVDLVATGGKLYVYFNDIETWKVKKPKMEHSSFGFMVGSKNKMVAKQFGFKAYAVEEDED